MYRKIRFALAWMAGIYKTEISRLSLEKRKELGENLIQTGIAGGDPFAVLSGHTPEKREDGISNFDTLGILSIATAMPCAIAAGFFLNAEPFPESPTRATGEVLRLERGVLRANPRYFRIIGFETLEGEAVEVRDPTPSKHRFPLGKKIEVTYNAHDPEDAAITGSLGFWLNWIITAAGAVTSVLFGFALIGNLAVIAIGRKLK